MPLVFSGQRPTKLLNILQCIGQPLTAKNYPPPKCQWNEVEKPCVPTSAFNPFPAKSIHNIPAKIVTPKLKFKSCCFLVKSQTLQRPDSFISCCCPVCSLCYSYTSLFSASWIPLSHSTSGALHSFFPLPEMLFSQKAARFTPLSLL